MVDNVLNVQKRSSQRERIQPEADDSINQANSLNGNGLESYEKGDYNGAVNNFKLALEMRRRLFPGNSNSVAQSYNNLGYAFNGMKDYNKAIEHHKLALEMRKRLFPRDHQDVADSYNNIGYTYYGMKDYISAIENHKQALEIRKRLFPGDHEDVAFSYNNLSIVYNEIISFHKLICDVQSLYCNRSYRYKQHQDYYTNRLHLHGPLGTVVFSFTELT